MISYSSQTVFLCSLLSCVWLDRQGGVADCNGKVPGKITVRCRVTGPGGVPLRLPRAPLARPFALLAFHLTWNELRRERRNAGLHAPDQQLPTVEMTL